MHHMLDRIRDEDDGAGLVEYALLLAMIAVVCLSALAFFGTDNQGSIGDSADCLEQSTRGGVVPAECQ